MWMEDRIHSGFALGNSTLLQQRFVTPAFIYPLFLYLPGFSWFWEAGVRKLSLGAAFFPALSKDSLSLAPLPTAAAFITHL